MKLMNGEKSVIGRRDRITIRLLSKKKNVMYVSIM